LTDPAIAYQAGGRAAEAVILLEQALADCERVLGGEHPKTLQTRRDLASAYQAASRTAEPADPGPHTANQAPESLRDYAAPASSSPNGVSRALNAGGVSPTVLPAAGPVGPGRRKPVAEDDRDSNRG
jgi:hypothetical protein